MTGFGTGTCPVFAEKPSPLPSLRIAVVDDEVVLLRVLERYLVMRGHRVDVYDSGVKFLNSWPNSKKYDLVMLDICMPSMDGMEVLDVMSTRERTLPRIVIISGYDSTGLLPQALKNHRVSYLPKPFRLEALAEMIQNTTP